MGKAFEAEDSFEESRIGSIGMLRILETKSGANRIYNIESIVLPMFQIASAHFPSRRFTGIALRKKINALQGPRREPCVPVITTSEYSKGEAARPAMIKPEVAVISAIKYAPTSKQIACMAL